MKKNDLKDRFPLTSWSEEDVGGSKVVSFSFRWTVPQEFIDLSDYPTLSFKISETPRPPQVLIEARAQVVGDNTVVLNSMEIFFDLRQTAKSLGVELAGPGRAGFSPQRNYILFLSGLVASMEAVVAQCRTSPSIRQTKKEAEVKLRPELHRLAEDFASSEEWADKDEAKARFLILAIESFPP